MLYDPDALANRIISNSMYVSITLGEVCASERADYTDFLKITQFLNP